MANKHIVELLVEANKGISGLITKLENDDSHDYHVAIDYVNDVIRQLDNVVEHLERK